tara:strand:+ start:96 stop:290 length:195 start_codon:yes stop_codon:yes gene_type:complete
MKYAIQILRKEPTSGVTEITMVPDTDYDLEQIKLYKLAFEHGLEFDTHNPESCKVNIILVEGGK